MGHEDYLHSEDRAVVVSCYFAHLKHLAVTTFPDNFAQFEVLRPDLLARAIDILFRYRHYLHHVRQTGSDKEKGVRRASGPRTAAWTRRAGLLTLRSHSGSARRIPPAKRKTDAALVRGKHVPAVAGRAVGISVRDNGRSLDREISITASISMTSSSGSSLCSGPASCSSISKIADIVRRLSRCRPSTRAGIVGAPDHSRLASRAVSTH